MSAIGGYFLTASERVLGRRAPRTVIAKDQQAKSGTAVAEGCGCGHRICVTFAKDFPPSSHSKRASAAIAFIT